MTATLTRGGLADAVRRLPPVSLEQVVDEAALLTRVDRKYVVPPAAAAALVVGSPAGTRALSIDGEQVLGYRSTYFDTTALDAYHRSVHGHRRRFKVRVRTYLDSGDSWLEVKTRGPRGAAVKERTPHPPGGEDVLDDAGRAFVAERLAARGVRGVDVAGLAAVLVTAYRRSTLLVPPATGDGAASRVTLDTQLGWTALLDGARDLDRPRLVVVETKAGSTPTEVDRWLWAHGHRPIRISKYGVGLAALTPSLPDHRWRRTLRLHVH